MTDDKSIVIIIFNTNILIRYTRLQFIHHGIATFTSRKKNKTSPYNQVDIFLSFNLAEIGSLKSFDMTSEYHTGYKYVNFAKVLDFSDKALKFVA